MVKKIDASNWQSCEEVKACWPDISGNSVNGLGESEARPPTPVMWHDPSIIPFGEVQKWFASRGNTHKHIARFGSAGEAGGRQLPQVAESRPDWNADRWTQEVKAAALDAGADLVGITRVQSDWIFEGYRVDRNGP